MKKMSCLFLCCALAVLPMKCYAVNIQGGVLENLDFPENTIAYVSQDGSQTDGITYIVHDVYFDGYLLMLSITQIANDGISSVYEDEVYGYSREEKLEEINFQLGEKASVLGSFCEVYVYGEDGKEVSSLQRCHGSPDGLALVETFSYSFLPDEIQNELNVTVSYGVVETPGEVEAAELNTIEISIPILSKPFKECSDKMTLLIDAFMPEAKPACRPISRIDAAK